MPDRSSKPKHEDLNSAAHRITQKATGQEQPKPEDRQKDPAAVELGRRGGKKGGKARAEKLTAEQRREIAKKAADARWAARAGDGLTDD